MATHFLRSIPLFALALASAHCGGKTAGPEVVGDAAVPAHDALTSPDGRTVRPDTGAPCPSAPGLLYAGASCDWGGVCSFVIEVCGAEDLLPLICEGGAVAIQPGVDYGCATRPDAGEGPPPPECPTPTEVGSGATCSGDMQCEGEIEIAGCGSIPETCECSNGRFACAAASCGGSGSSGTGSGTTCPGDVQPGGACSGTMQCATQYCGPGDFIPCTCEEGEWSCPGIAVCMPPSHDAG